MSKIPKHTTEKFQSFILSSSSDPLPSPTTRLSVLLIFQYFPKLYPVEIPRLVLLLSFPLIAIAYIFVSEALVIQALIFISYAGLKIRDIELLRRLWTCVLVQRWSRFASDGAGLYSMIFLIGIGCVNSISLKFTSKDSSRWSRLCWRLQFISNTVIILFDELPIKMDTRMESSTWCGSTLF